MMGLHRRTFLAAGAALGAVIDGLESDVVTLALPSVEATLPLEHSVVKGEELHLNLLTMRLFSAR